jgi:hypothetical protein
VSKEDTKDNHLNNLRLAAAAADESSAFAEMSAKQESSSVWEVSPIGVGGDKGLSLKERRKQ